MVWTGPVIELAASLDDSKQYTNPKRNHQKGVYENNKTDPINPRA
jgi:hypothetical protein